MAMERRLKSRSRTTTGARHTRGRIRNPLLDQKSMGDDMALYTTRLAEEKRACCMISLSTDTKKACASFEAHAFRFVGSFFARNGVTRRNRISVRSMSQHAGDIRRSFDDELLGTLKFR